MTAHLTLRAFAKINLDLRVLRKRPDGFHEIATVFQTISLADRITVRFERAAGLTVELTGTVDIPDNLIARAARAIADELASGGRFHFHLEKRIPMGAGLGGGSSDAAAVLQTLPSLMNKPVSPERLHAIAATLGSDVPFFLYGGTALGLGRGEELYPLPDARADRHGLLVVPDIHVSTAEAYRLLSAQLDPNEEESKHAQLRHVLWTEDLSQARNDFEEPIFAAYPEVGRIRDELARAGAQLARMTGSGSAVFGLFENELHRTKAQAAISDFRTMPFNFVSRREVASLAITQ